jgi:hypothetical protein
MERSPGARQDRARKALARARANRERFGAHPWRWSSPFPLLTIAVPLIVNPVMGVSVKIGLVEGVVVAPFVWLVFRWYMPWIARRAEARAQRRYDR